MNQVALQLCCVCVPKYLVYNFPLSKFSCTLLNMNAVLQIVGLCILLLMSLPLIWMGIRKWQHTPTRTKELENEQIEMVDLSPSPPPDQPGLMFIRRY